VQNCRPNIQQNPCRSNFETPFRNWGQFGGGGGSEEGRGNWRALEE
jgi:hypothetical protein